VLHKHVEAAPWGRPLRKKMSGDVLLSHNLPVAVPSALKGLTSGFGMEPGVSLSLWPPKLYGVMSDQNHDPYRVVPAPDRNSGTTQWTRNIFEGQALGLLVPVGSVHCCLQPPAYQPSHLLGALPG
jgi:hypothetical protein